MPGWVVDLFVTVVVIVGVMFLVHHWMWLEDFVEGNSDDGGGFDLWPF